jgi:dTMP kinase
MNGKLVTIDGIDGAGKGTLVKGLASHFEYEGRKVCDLSNYCKKNKSLPEFSEIAGYDVLLSNEPTYSWVGLAIRDEIISDNKRDYSPLDTATSYSLDRLILYKRIIIPALNEGLLVINDRSVTTSIVYQPIQDEKKTEPVELLAQIMELSGNKLALEYRPDLLLIASLAPQTAVERLAARVQKNDKSIFDRLDFLIKADQRFRSEWFRRIFESRGSRVAYIDMNTTIEDEVSRAIKEYTAL